MESEVLEINDLCKKKKSKNSEILRKEYEDCLEGAVEVRSLSGASSDRFPGW